MRMLSCFYKITTKQSTLLIVLFSALLCMSAFIKFHKDRMRKIAASEQRLNTFYYNRIMANMVDDIDEYVVKHNGHLPGKIGSNDPHPWCDSIKPSLASNYTVVNTNPCTIQVFDKYSPYKHFYKFYFKFSTSYSGKLVKSHDLSDKDILFKCSNNGQIFTMDFLNSRR